MDQLQFDIKSQKIFLLSYFFFVDSHLMSSFNMPHFYTPLRIVKNRFFPPLGTLWPVLPKSETKFQPSNDLGNDGEYTKIDFSVILPNTSQISREKIAFFVPACIAKKQQSRVAKKQLFLQNIDLFCWNWKLDCNFLQHTEGDTQSWLQYSKYVIFTQICNGGQANVAIWQHQEIWSISPKRGSFPGHLSSRLA